jgi:uncharacterized protein
VKLNTTRSFPPGIAEDLHSYVYIYADPRTDEIFYIGKGVGNRVFSHLDEAEKSDRDSEKVRKIGDIWQAGLDVIVRIHRHGMTPDQALHVEASLIQLFPDAKNEVEGHSTTNLGDRLVSDLISEKAREKAEFDFPVVLINIRKEWLRIKPTVGKPLDLNQLYMSTRTAWDIQPSRHEFVRHAVSTAFGIVRQIYEVERWLPADINADGTPRPEDSRWMFEGKIAQNKQYLVGKAVDHLQKPGAQNAIRWLDKGTSVQAATS